MVDEAHIWQRVDDDVRANQERMEQLRQQLVECEQQQEQLKLFRVMLACYTETAGPPREPAVPTEVEASPGLAAVPVEPPAQPAPLDHEQRVAVKNRLFGFSA